VTRKGLLAIPLTPSGWGNPNRPTTVFSTAKGIKPDPKEESSTKMLIYVPDTK
jgi:hypothetical protein